ncbi:acyl--CoA ligase [Nocardioides anomalus]|uniref:Acyl--CoA ligase n=1 Tax=Nocardioides anomalus TaxID=2712223 RepID=A0A6G6WIQ5_9ACTN|nr:class I adenylate-forming enzyme family protein [Nocardioides anomalus]QIG45086.1 acyl--CoA ligase [Nocardioides anomalus]
MTGLLIGDLLQRGLVARPHTAAATLGDDTVSFADLDARAQRTTAGLRALGVGPGQVVAWWAAPSLRALDVFVASARLGAVFAPLNPTFSVPEVAATLDLLDPTHLVTDRAHLDAARAAAADRPVRVAELGAVDRAAPEATSVPLPDVDEHSAHIAYLTSGSTGRPKAVLVSHRASWLRAGPGGGTFAAPLRGEGVVCTFPLFHYGGWHYVMEAWQNMTAVHLVARADAEHVVAAVERRRPAALYCIPAVWERVVDPLFGAADLSSLRHADTGTSPVAGELVERIKRRLPGTTTTILYGSTEAGRMAALQDHDLERKAGSVGQPAFPCTLWTDAEGQVWVRTPAAMNGYLGAAGSGLVDGAYASGDTGRLDDDGYLHLTGRTSELIRSGGEYVAPAEVEAALRVAPGVADLAVVGVPDPRWGEVVCAVVVAAPGTVPTLDGLRGHVRDRLASYKHPRRLVLVDAIPRTAATGQVQRTRLGRELVEAQPAAT